MGEWGYDEIFKIMMKEYFSSFSKVITENFKKKSFRINFLNIFRYKTEFRQRVTQI